MNDVKLRKKQFIRFLKENNCYKEFCINFYNFQNKTDYIINKLTIDELVFRFITFRSNSEIDDAFCWLNTNQGDDYWRTINNKWKELTNGIKQIKCFRDTNIKRRKKKNHTV